MNQDVVREKSLFNLGQSSYEDLLFANGVDLELIDFMHYKGTTYLRVRNYHSS